MHTAPIGNRFQTKVLDRLARHKHRKITTG